MKSIRFPGKWLAVGLLAPSFWAFGQQPAPTAELVGSETCLACHEISKPFFATTHSAVECEDCHGPGSLHVEAGGEELSVSFSHRGANWSVARCLECHSKNTDLAAFVTSNHSEHGLACQACHNVHPDGPSRRLLRERQFDLCSDCHATAASGFLKPFHHPVREGAMQCSDCHNPHLENRPSLTRLTAGTEEGCVSCHSDKAGPFVFEHASLRIDDCQTCHEPHGSVNGKMLRRSQVHLLCLECHATNAGTLGITPPSFHDLRSARFRNCTTCHRQIHGSNVSPAFLR